MKYLKTFENHQLNWKTNLKSFLSSNGSYQVPFEALKEISTWDFIHKSPYSLSFYNSEKDWSDDKDGIIRISNHWNFETKGELHAKTDKDIKNTWARGVSESGVYKISKVYNMSPDNETLIRKFYKEFKSI